MLILEVKILMKVILTGLDHLFLNLDQVLNHLYTLQVLLMDTIYQLLLMMHQLYLKMKILRVLGGQKIIQAITMGQYHLETLW